jgi:Flp pilus assembly secretin CpaC
MRFYSLYIPVILALAAVLTSSACGQTLQLPTFEYFTVNTTVSVPDGGTTYMGGVNRSSAGRTSGGVPLLGKVPFAGRPFGNRAIGRDMSAAGVSATARIIILEEEEAKLGLTGSPLAPGDSLSAMERRAAFLAGNVARSKAPRVASVVKNPALPTAEEIRRRNVLAGQQRDREADFFAAKGDAAAEAGKLNVAAIYYRMASNRTQGEQKDEILAKLHAVMNSDSLAAGSR